MSTLTVCRAETQEILKLKAQIQCQEKDLLRERDILDNLRVQMAETQASTYQLVQGLDTKVTSLTELCQNGNHQSKRSHDLASHLSEKYGTIHYIISYTC